jgi:hypothetical protein
VRPATVRENPLSRALDTREVVGPRAGAPFVPHVTFMPVDLVPIRMRMIRAQKAPEPGQRRQAIGSDPAGLCQARTTGR